LATLIQGGYKVERTLEEWADGVLYAAFQASLQRRVLLRMDKFRSDSMGTAEKSRLLSTARKAGNLNHQNVVRVLEAGETEDWVFVTMEYSSDTTLDKLIKDKGRLTAKEALDMSLQVLAALEYALNQDATIHGELKPNVIYVAPDGVVKVAEFGMERRRSRVQLGREVQYVPPEKASGGKTDERSDIYSLGAILYRAVSGRVPFPELDPKKVLAQQVEQDPKPIREIAPDVPVELAAVIETAMRKDPRMRYQSPGQMASALKGVKLQ
jgi:serine/threonine-protein kinase